MNYDELEGLASARRQELHEEFQRTHAARLVTLRALRRGVARSLLLPMGAGPLLVLLLLFLLASVTTPPARAHQTELIMLAGGNRDDAGNGVAAGGAESDRGLGTALDPAGNSYVTGFFTDKARRS